MHRFHIFWAYGKWQVGRLPLKYYSKKNPPFFCHFSHLGKSVFSGKKSSVYRPLHRELCPLFCFSLFSFIPPLSLLAMDSPWFPGQRVPFASLRSSYIADGASKAGNQDAYIHDLLCWLDMTVANFSSRSNKNGFPIGDVLKDFCKIP